MFPKKTRPLLPFLFLSLASAPALADDPSAKIQTAPESGLLRGLTDDLESRREQLETNSGLRKKNAAAQEEGEDIPDLDDEDLKKHPELANRVLNAAMLSEDWDTLEHVSGFYRDIPGHDPVLDAYVRGALLRAQGRPGKSASIWRACCLKTAPTKTRPKSLNRPNAKTSNPKRRLRPTPIWRR